MTTGPNPSGLRFPASRRLKLSREFVRVRTEGRTIRGGLLLLGVLELAEENAFRVGFVTSKRVGGAVVRNRVRRRLREIVRRHQRELRDGVWLVVVARPAAAPGELGGAGGGMVEVGASEAGRCDPLNPPNPTPALAPAPNPSFVKLMERGDTMK